MGKGQLNFDMPISILLNVSRVKELKSLKDKLTLRGQN